MESVDATSAVCKALCAASLQGLIVVARAALHKVDPMEEPEASCLCEADRQLIASFSGKALDFLALSYCESGAQIDEARHVLNSHGLTDTAIWAKLETGISLQRLDEIVRKADGVIISRGNLGVSVPLASMASIQKRIIVVANLASKPVAITRLMDSMTNAPRPTRAEATDVANAVLDGVDGFLLGAETERGLFPVACCAEVLRISAEAETVFEHRGFFYSRMDKLNAFRGSEPGLSLRASMASTLVRVAEKTEAKLLIVFTKSGRHALEVSLWRPGPPILALFQPCAPDFALSIDPHECIHTASSLSADSGVSWQVRGMAETRRALLLRGVIPVLADPSDGLNEARR